MVLKLSLRSMGLTRTFLVCGVFCTTEIKTMKTSHSIYANVTRMENNNFLLPDSVALSQYSDLKIYFVIIRQDVFES